MGITRITRRRSGGAKYLRDGRKKESQYSRDERDLVVPVYGDLNSFEKVENFLNKEKNFKHNYLHITFSFSPNDQKKFDLLDEKKQMEMMKGINKFLLIHHTSGHDLDSEVIAYAEWHFPKIKKETARFGRDKGVEKERLGHQHLFIANYNPLSDTELRTTFAKTQFMDDVLQAYINNVFGLDHPKIDGERNRGKERLPKSHEKRQYGRDYYIEELKNITTYDELLDYLKTNKIEYDEVKTTYKKDGGVKNNYIKIINDKGIDNINLRDSSKSNNDFKHIEYIVQNKGKVAPKELMPTPKRKYNKYPDQMSIEKQEEILSSFYMKRIEEMDGRRSKKTKALIKEIFKEKEVDNNENTISMSYQEKLYYKHYKHLVSVSLKGYSVDTNNEKEPKFINKAKDIVVIDKGDKITSNKSKAHLEEKVRLMLDISEAKGWRLSTLDVAGSDEFRAEVAKQIEGRLATKRKEVEKDKTLHTEQTAVIKSLQRPTSELEHLAKAHKDKMQTKDLPLAELKQMLKAQSVLDHALERYKLDPSQYEVTADNKIKHLGRKAKPKNVIDFLQKEINLTSKEAIAECQILYKIQPLEVHTVDMPMPVQVLEPIKLKQRKEDHEYTEQQRATAIHQSTDRENRGRERQTRSDLQELSSSNLVLSGRGRTAMLLSADESNRVQQEREADNGVQSARARDNQTPSEARREIGGVKMPLHISINKTSQPNANTGWEVVEVQGYAELATLMKQHPYASSRFDKKRDADNANTFNNLLVFDVDNDSKDKQLSIKEAKALLEKKGISAMILPTNNHQKEKLTDSGKSKGIKDRYRIVIPTKSAIRNNTDKDTYEEFQKLTAHALELTGCVDTSALKDKARYYYQSPVDAVPVVVKADKVMDISNLENKAIENVTQVRAEKEAQRLKMEDIRSNIRKYRVVTMPTSKNLTYVDAQELMDVPINTLILKLERGKEEEEGRYKYIKTDDAKYSIIEDKLAHDFKNNITYNSLTYLQMQYETNNLSVIARELSKITGEDYLKVNTEAVRTAVKDALKTATNDKSFEASIREYFGCEHCKLEKDSIKIADQKISLRDIDTDKGKVVEKLKENRIATKSIDEKAKERNAEKKEQVKHKKNKGIEIDR